MEASLLSQGLTSQPTLTIIIVEIVFLFSNILLIFFGIYMNFMILVLTKYFNVADMIKTWVRFFRKIYKKCFFFTVFSVKFECKKEKNSDQDPVFEVSSRLKNGEDTVRNRKAGKKFRHNSENVELTTQERLQKELNLSLKLCHYNYSPYNFLLANMALADLIYLLVQPFFAMHLTTRTWHFGQLGCKLFSGIDFSFFLICPTFTCLIAIERLFMINNKHSNNLAFKQTSTQQKSKPPNSGKKSGKSSTISSSLFGGSVNTTRTSIYNFSSLDISKISQGREIRKEVGSNPINNPLVIDECEEINLPLNQHLFKNDSYGSTSSRNYSNNSRKLKFKYRLCLKNIRKDLCF